MASQTAAEKFKQALARIEVDWLFEAMPLLDEVIEAQPEWREPYVQRARIRRRLKNYEGAIADYAKALKLAPTAQTYLARALVWLAMEKIEGAIADSRSAIALNPKLAGAHRLLGKALGLFGDGVGAIAAYKQAARCYIDEQDKANAQICIDRIEPLRSLPPLPPKISSQAPADVPSTMPAEKPAEKPVASPTDVKAGSATTAVLIKSYFRQLPVVEVLFDGIAKFDVVIDRNAPNSIITQQMANQLNLDLVSYRYVYLADGTPMELSIARLWSVVIGTTVITDVDVAIAPNNATVVLGKDCFSAYSIRISGNEMTFIPRR
ncbi:MAG: retroviral-like aspartic protease family protein [Phormidesmis sp.]